MNRRENTDTSPAGLRETVFSRDYFLRPSFSMIARERSISFFWGQPCRRIGVDGVARKIKAAYIGIGGVARPCWAGGAELVYYGTATALSTARGHLAATTIGNYALFGGGYTSSSVSSVVNAYDQTLTRPIPTALSTAREYLAATTIGNYALFGGGNPTSGSFTPTAALDVYTTI